MTVDWIISWWNLIFILPFGLGLMYLGLYTVSGWTFGDAEAEVGFDHDIDAHLDVDGHIEIDHDLSNDLHTDVDSDADSDTDTDSDTSETSALLTALNWVGVGRVPMSLVLMILMLCWGAIGFGTIQVQRGTPIAQSVIIASLVAAVASLFITHAIASVLGPMLYSTKNLPRRRHELLGSRGEAMFPIDEHFGMVCGRDERGDLFQIACRIEQGYEPVPKGSAVQLVGYAAKERMFYVIPAESAITPRRVVEAK